MALWKVQLGDDALRLPRPATLLAQTPTPRPLYVVSGGAIRVLSIMGKVTTAVQAQANATKIQAKATGQTAVDMCATGEINGLAVGQVVGITGVAATALQLGWAIVGQTTPWIVVPGTIDMNCAAASTGAMSWVLRWLPLDPGAAVALA